MKNIKFPATIIVALTLSSCSQELFNAPTQEEVDNSGRIQLAGEINQVATTRVNDDGFADGDVMGVYIVDYNGNNPGTLLSKGNRGDNVRHTFNESAYRWDSAYDLYWKDKHTRIDVYGYYPFGSPDNVNTYEFTVLTNQNGVSTENSMGGYEASDFLWGKVEGVEPTTNIIRLPLTHRMANARVTLTEGSGFTDGEWADLEKQVLVANTIQGATIDLASGTVTATGNVGRNSIIPSRRGDEWRAIVVPQTIPAGTTMFSLTIGGMPYKFSRSDDFTYLPGKMSNFTIRVDKKEPSGDYTLTLVSESITAWETDLVSHDASSKEYVIVESTPGKLKQAIIDAGKDYTKLKNLKITGEVDSRDFYFMRDEMDALQALNLKEVKIQAFGREPIYNIACKEDQIPASAFYSNATVSGKNSLTRIILPDKLKSIGARAFYGCRNLTGSLIIPEGVIDIQQGAFYQCKSLTGSLSLPSTLKYIGNSQSDNTGEIDLDKDEGIDYYNGVFSDCGFTCELIIPDNVELIRGSAFGGCKGFYGSLRLPEKLKRIGWRAFFQCLNFSGSLEIPQGVTDIPEEVFANCGFDGNLILHDGIASIGMGAFNGCHFKGELALPKNLTVINDNVFYGCDFSGELVLPKTLVTIGDKAFAYNWRLMGTLEFAEGLITIGAGAFAHCRSLEGLVFPESLENIRYEASYYEDGGAFQGCYGIGSIVSKSGIPPYIQQGAFDGVAKDNFTLEVPESSVAQYQTAVGWCDFKRIAAHHELVCRPAVACALSTEHHQTLVIDSEGDWVLDSKPDWCELSQNSGNKKSEITLTIKSTAAGDIREGDVVFRLKDKDYTHTCHVTQYGYEYGEDQYLTLQKATKGKNGGINIVILGDGYDAKEIAGGEYLKDMKQQVENFFGIEPYTTYREYFNVYTAFPLSTESGVGTINSIRYNRFNTTYTGGVGLKCDYDELTDYVLNAPTVNEGNIDQTLVIVVPNSTDYGGICQMWASGYAIAFCPKSDYGYPLDTRGVIQHEAGGHGFGKLADEYIYHNAFIDACDCTCCGHVDAINWAKSLGWYDNISLTGKIHEVRWSHLIFDPRYSDIVDIFEGGFMHNRGVFRSEQNSCMNNNIPYYSTISRQSIVKRIKAYAGETFDFEEFVANDKRTSQVLTRGFDSTSGSVHSRQLPPVIHKGSPIRKK
ncbi:MAG: leucine-rich repeat protein [Muribaculaceae bacterium]|nr:leucine-rich repeat protein [Muribaculaceae bacterium]